jgi:hypothetical protein
MEVTIHLSEDETDTVVRAVLNIAGDHFESTGKARRNPEDPLMPVVGEELALSRALHDLAGQLTDAARNKIEHFNDS